jgi:hypothetical protein
LRYPSFSLPLFKSHSVTGTVERHKEDAIERKLGRVDIDIRPTY